jgi:hypothetical protein
MRVGVTLSVTLGLLASAAAAACSGGYPLPPTRCDEWCDATKGGSCEAYYSPAGCVSGCEASHVGDDACVPAFDAVISCYKQHPDAVDDQCRGFIPGQPVQCITEKEQLSGCIEFQYLIGGIKR